MGKNTGEMLVVRVKEGRIAGQQSVAGAEAVHEGSLAIN